MSEQLSTAFREKSSIPAVLRKIAAEIASAGGRSYLVGGWVRDSMLGRDSKDFDVEVYGLDFAELEKILKKFGKPNLVGAAFGVMILRAEGHTFDFAFPRTESKTGKGHRGFMVKAHKDLSFRQAAERRDFTINAMGIQLPELKLEDPWGGAADLQRRVLRHVGPAFGEDPLRALRAVQFASRFELAIPAETQAICAEQDLGELSRDRFVEEFRKWLMQADKPAVGWKYLWDMKLVRFFPELFTGAGTFWHQLQPGIIPFDTVELQGNDWKVLSFAKEATEHNYAVLRNHCGLFRQILLDALAKSWKTWCQSEERQDLQNELHQRLPKKKIPSIHPLGSEESLQKSGLGLMLGALNFSLTKQSSEALLRRISDDQNLLEYVQNLTHFLQLVFQPDFSWSQETVQRAGLLGYLPVHLLFLDAVQNAMQDATEFTSISESADFPRNIGVGWMDTKLARELAQKQGVWYQAASPWLRGNDLIQAGFKPGPVMGQIIQEAFELQLVGRLKDRQSALDWLGEQIASRSL